MAWVSWYGLVKSSKRMQTCFPIAWSQQNNAAWWLVEKCCSKINLHQFIYRANPCAKRKRKYNYKAIMSCNLFPDHLGDKSFLAQFIVNLHLPYIILPHLSTASLCACNALDIIACNWTSSCSVAPAQERLTTNHANANTLGYFARPEEWHG